MKKARISIAVCCAIAVVSTAGCLSQVQRGAGFVRGAHGISLPAGIGPGAGELKKSPCACITLDVGPHGIVGAPTGAG